jgi:hypothetical protein
MIAGIIAGAFGLFFLLAGAVIGLLIFVFWIWMLIHAITNKGLTDGEKILWVLVVIFLHFIGAIIYFFLGKPRGQGIGD